MPGILMTEQAKDGAGPEAKCPASADKAFQPLSPTLAPVEGETGPADDNPSSPVSRTPSPLAENAKDNSSDSGSRLAVWCQLAS